MKRISVFIIAISIFSAGVISCWLYLKYFHDDRANVLTFPVTRGNVVETVKVRGEAVSQKEFNLGFAAGGTVAAIFVEEGEMVKEGAALVKLDTRSYELEVSKLAAVLAQKQSNLEKLLAGYTSEDVAVTETKLLNAEQNFADKKQSLENYLNDSYTKASNAVGVYVDQFFENPRGTNPSLNITIADSELTNLLGNRRLQISSNFPLWQSSLAKLSSDNLIESAEEAVAYLEEIRDFLEEMATAVNSLTSTASLTATTISTYRSDISTARTAVNTAITNLTDATESLSTAESALELAKSELKLKVAGPRPEDTAAARAQIAEAESDLATARDKIRKATLTAPVESKIMKIAVEKGETLIAGETAIILAASQNKIQADVSELDIVKIPEDIGAEASIKFDAFPGLDFAGKVVSIEPKEIVKDGDKYYRVNFYFDSGEVNIRSGMSADLEVKIAEKTDVLLIPDYVIYQKDGKSFVKMEVGGKEEEIAVATGLSDGESTEIVSGLSEGDVVIVSAN